MDELDLPGIEQGKRNSETEWGLRYTRSNRFAKKGEVVFQPSETQARFNEGESAWGWADTEVVSRVVVTYTTDWSRSDG